MQITIEEMQKNKWYDRNNFNYIEIEKLEKLVKEEKAIVAKSRKGPRQNHTFKFIKYKLI